MRPKKLLFYTPGIYSLALLLPALMLQFYWYTISRKQFTTEVIWYDPNDTTYFKRTIPTRNYAQVRVNGNNISSKAQLDSIKRAVYLLASKVDTTNGVHVHFADTARYESFVEILNAVNSSDSSIDYRAYQNDFWIFNRTGILYRESRMKFYGCGTYQMMLRPPKQSRADFVFEYYFDKRLLPVATILILSGFLAWRKVKRLPLTHSACPINFTLTFSHWMIGL
jgi:hypothetical protein